MQEEKVIERYDLECGIEGLDVESVLALLEQTDCWRRRASLRARWILRSEWERRELR